MEAKEVTVQTLSLEDGSPIKGSRPNTPEVTVDVLIEGEAK